MRITKHATVTRDGYEVPLIGILESAVMGECDLCHESLPISKLEFNGTQMLCAKCRESKLWRWDRP